MINKHAGSRVSDHIRELSKKNPGLRKAIDEHKEKAQLALLLQRIREAEGMTQKQLADNAGIPQSAIARMESATPTYHPSILTLKHVINSAGYQLKLVAMKRGKKLELAFQ